MNEIQLTDHWPRASARKAPAAIIEPKSTSTFRESLYAMSLKRLERKCLKYAKRERKAIAYVATLTRRNHER